MMMPGDADAVKGRTLRGSALRRAWRFARPYRRTIIVFLSAIVLAAAVELVAPFAFRRILDHAIPAGDRSEITLLAGLVVAAALLVTIGPAVLRFLHERHALPAAA